MATTADLINQTRLHLQSNSRDELNRLTSDPGAAGVTWTFDFPLGGIQRGALLEADLELAYVWATSSPSATVQRGQLGSTGATHAIGTLVRVNPRFSNFTILSALNDEIRSYSSPARGLYRIRTVDLTYSAAYSGYDLTAVTDLISPLSLMWEDVINRAWHPVTRYTLGRNLPTDDFASAKALFVYEDGVLPGRTIRMAYKAPYSTLATLADNVTTVAGLHDEAMDIPPLGAAARLLAGRESRRAQIDTHPESRQAEAVPPGANRQSAAALIALRDQRLREEAGRLRAMYPVIHRRAS